MNNPETLRMWSERMLGARLLLELLQKDYKIQHKTRASKDEQAYCDAELRLAAESPDNMNKFLSGTPIGYRGHKRDKKGKLVSVEAFFVR